MPFGVSFAEKGGTVTNTERCVQRQRPAIPPLQGTRTDLAVLVALAGRLGVRFDQTSYEGIFTEIAETVPLYRGLTLAAIGWQGARRPSGVRGRRRRPPSYRYSPSPSVRSRRRSLSCRSLRR